MITEGALSWFVSGVTTITDAIPKVDLPLAGAARGWAHVFDLNWFLPIAEVSAAVAAVLAITPALLITSITSWLVIGVARGGQSHL